jgi:hypothetical protein
MCQQDDLSVRELKRVVMTVQLTHVDLLEPGYPVPEPAREDDPGFASNLFFKGKLGPWEQTNSYLRVVDRSKTARDGVGKTRRYELVAYLRRAGCDEF